jgi:ligand-binding SRPBCC domain-containing protein
MRYQHSFTVKASQEAVAAFHAHPRSLRKLVPPPAILRFLTPLPAMEDGARFTFLMLLGPIPVIWESVFEDVSEGGFVDVQGERGPFRYWRHHHIFEAVDAETTAVIDEIEAEIRLHPWYGFVGFLMWVTLPFLFWYRQWRTRRDLEGAA